jgi:hypothetical protein
MQILHPLYSLVLLLSLSLIRKRLYSYGTLAMALGLKSTNYSPVFSLGTYVTFFQTLGFIQTLSLSLYHLLLSSSQTLKQIPLKRVIPYPISEELIIYVISVFKSKQPFFSRYLYPK